MNDITKKRSDQLRTIMELAPLEDDPGDGDRGVLLSDQITFYSVNHKLISPFCPENLKPAGYELTVGDEYFSSGEFLELNNSVTILPFEVAVIKTGEIIRLPRFMIARWNIRVKHAYEGLLWVGGPQVDPGYVGHLFCPIYNLSDKPVTLRRGEPLALMDFQRTTRFDKDKPLTELKRYKLPPSRLILQDYEIEDFQSALFTRAGRKLDEFEDSLRSLEGRFITFTQISFAMLALFFSLLAIYTKVGTNLLQTIASLGGAAIVMLSVMAFLMALFGFLNLRLARVVPERHSLILSRGAAAAKKILRLYWWGAFAMILAVTLGVGFWTYKMVDPILETARKDLFVTRGIDGHRLDQALKRLTELEIDNRAMRNQVELLRSSANGNTPRINPR